MHHQLYDEMGKFTKRSCISVSQISMMGWLWACLSMFSCWLVACVCSLLKLIAVMIWDCIYWYLQADVCLFAALCFSARVFILARCWESCSSWTGPMSKYTCTARMWWHGHELCHGLESATASHDNSLCQSSTYVYNACSWWSCSYLRCIVSWWDALSVLVGRTTATLVLVTFYWQACTSKVRC